MESQPHRRFAALLAATSIILGTACGPTSLATPPPTAAPTRAATSALIAQRMPSLPLVLPSTTATTATTPRSPLPPATGLPACEAADLIARWVGTNAATGGYMHGGIEFANVSQRPCTVGDVPTLLFYDATHSLLPFTVTDCTLTSAYLCPVQVPAVLLPVSALPPRHFPSDVPGEEVVVPVMWQQIREFIPCAPQIATPVAEIAVRLPRNGGDLPLQDAFYNGVAGDIACNATLFIGAFAPLTR